MSVSLRVLIVDDSPDDALLLEEMLRAGGFEPQSQRVETAAAMRKALTTASWDLVLADYTLHSFSGRIALRVLRDCDIDIPFILVSGTIGDERAVEIMKAGAQDYIHKGNLTRLVPAVARELREADMRQRHKRTEEELHQSEERYRNFIRQSTEGIYRFEFDPPIPITLPTDEQIRLAFAHGYFAESNDQFAQMYGFAHGEEMIGKRLGDLQLRSDDPEYRAFLIAFIEAGYRITDAITYEVDRDGNPLVISNSIVGIVDDGVLKWIWATQRDISERVRMQEALKASEDRYRSLVENISDWVWEVDERSIYTYASPRIRQLLGYEPEEVVGKTPFDFMPPGEAHRVAAIFASIVARLESFGLIENTAIAKDGHRVVLETSGIPLFDAQGRFRGYRGIDRDVTARKQAEAALERERAFLASAIELLPFPIIFNTPSGEVIRANRASYQFFGETDPSSWWQHQLFYTETGQPIAVDQWPMMRAARGEVVPPTEATFVSPGGKRVPILAVTAPIYVEGTLVATVISFTDVTPLKEADEAKNQFLNVISHELRTPLTSIIGWAQLARHHPETIPSALQVIVRSAQKQQATLERLLTLSSVLTGKLELRRVRGTLWPLVEETVEQSRTTLEEHQLTVRLVAPNDGLPAEVDRPLLRMAINELLENAIKFSPPKGVITITGRQADSLITIAIQDTGRGLTAEQIASLHAPFTQVQREERLGGFGVGLALARGILEAHGGWMKITSSGPGQGTTVTIAVPEMPE